MAENEDPKRWEYNDLVRHVAALTEQVALLEQNMQKMADAMQLMSLAMTKDEQAKPQSSILGLTAGKKVIKN